VHRRPLRNPDITAVCRFNAWVLTYVKGADLGDDQWSALLESTEAAVDRCKAAMTAFEASGSLEALRAEFLAVASHLE
jgi:hypothetical protein